MECLFKRELWFNFYFRLKSTSRSDKELSQRNFCIRDRHFDIQKVYRKIYIQEDGGAAEYCPRTGEEKSGEAAK